MSSSSSSDNNDKSSSSDGSRYLDRSDKFAAPTGYAADLARSRGDSANAQRASSSSSNDAVVPYAADYPVCAKCSRPFEHDFEERKYRCNFCMVTVSEKYVKQSLDVKNREKTLAELAAMSTEEQEQEIASRRNAIREQTLNNNKRARLSTQTGADNETGGYGSTASAGGSGGGGIFQIDDIHKHVRRQRAMESGRYSDHSRNSLRDEPTFMHPLDKELVERGFQVVESYELPRQPNSDAVVPKDERNSRKDDRGRPSLLL